jgi:hypothetical protein
MAYGTALVDTITSSGNLAVSGNVSINANLSSNNHVFNSISLGTASAGTFEYNGSVPYFTPSGTQRGVVPGMQYYVLNTGFAGSNATGAQSLFGVGVTLSSNTIYEYEYVAAISKSAGTTSHTVSFGFGGTATLNNISYIMLTQYNSSNLTTGAPSIFYGTTASQTVWTTAMTTASMTNFMTGRGVVSINAGGTFIPQYSLSAAPGGAYTTQAGGYMLIYPVGAAGSNVSVGTWA